MLKPAFEAIQSNNSSSFLLRTFQQEAFRAPYHFHPEYELTLITGGNGKRYTGNRMENFSSGDLVLLGANLPHCWKIADCNKDKFSTKISNVSNRAGAIVIQFTSDFLGKDFFKRPELKTISKLLRFSETGLQFTGKTSAKAEKKVKSLASKKDNFEKMIGFLQVLQQLALSKEYRLLCPQNISRSANQEEQHRIHQALSYIKENFRNKITLEKAAKMTNLSINAFCKYYKKITRQTFMETVIEYRLNYAAQQLVQTELPVASICFDSGFGDISHFNKTFKSKMQESPLQYRKRFVKGDI
jgi:AraC-like DNA-binding protein